MSMEEEAKVSLKLLIDTSSNKVLFAVTDKGFVDFLFHFMSLPIGTITKLIALKPDTVMVGCLGHLYKSIDSLSRHFLKPDVSKPDYDSLPPLFLHSDSYSDKFYICPNRKFPSSVDCRYVTDAKNTVCPKCASAMSVEMELFPPNVDESVDKGVGKSGYLKEAVTYMVMDNLEVKPMSAMFALSLLINTLNVKDVTSLVEKHVTVGFDEGMAILKASLETQSVFTTVFLENVKSNQGVTITVKKEAIS